MAATVLVLVFKETNQNTQEVKHERFINIIRTRQNNVQILPSTKRRTDIERHFWLVTYLLTDLVSY